MCGRVGKYDEIYRDKYTEELKQLKESILRGNDVKNECKRMVDTAEEQIQKEREEREEKGRKIREEKEEWRESIQKKKMRWKVNEDRKKRK